MPSRYERRFLEWVKTKKSTNEKTIKMAEISICIWELTTKGEKIAKSEMMKVLAAALPKMSPMTRLV